MIISSCQGLLDWYLVGNHIVMPLSEATLHEYCLIQWSVEGIKDCLVLKELKEAIAAMGSHHLFSMTCPTVVG
jgi:hypothetical protein